MAVKFLFLNDFDGGTVTASSEAAGCPVSYLKHRWHTRHWRSTGLAAEWVKVDLGSAKDIKALVIKYHNFQAGASVKIQANATDAWGAPSLDVTLTVTTDQIVKLWAAAQTYQWWRILITDAGNPDGYVRIGRPFLGDTSTLSQGFVLQYFHDLIDPSDIMYSFDGQASSNSKTKYRQMGYVFRGLTSSDKTTLEAVFEKVGTSDPYFFCEDVSNVLVYYVQNTSSWKIQGMKAVGDRYILTINMETMR